MTIIPLSSRAVIRIWGEGAEKLLHDTLTCRFDATLAGRGRWFALLSPQGKVQVEGLVTFADNSWWFDLDAGLVVDFVKRMKLYRLRAKADIEPLPTHSVAWSPDGEAPLGVKSIAYRDERTATMGTRYIVAEPSTVAPSSAYDAARIAAGIPEFPSNYGAGEVFAHDIGLDLLGGIDFVKGCYIGQEVVSRMKHRGTARRRPVIVSGIAASAASNAVLAGARDAGTIGNVVDGSAVAILRLDRITDPAAVTVGGHRVTLTLPDWATYQFGESTPED